MRKVNVSSVRTHRQIGAPATNQRKRKSTIFRTKSSEDRPDEQVKTLCSSRKEMAKTTPKAKMPGKEKMTADPRPLERHQLTPEDLGKVYQSIWDRN